MTLLSVPGIGLFFVIVLFLFAILLPLFALIDIIRNEFTGNNKLIWVIVVLLFPYLGAILYFIFGGSQKIRRW
ncbi:MAG: PLDc N-terminal domain-containing protein [Bacteroidales bacterium]|nr:PLDc N-terminal domain-containing protein [Bacteroidales bacterium]